jgi:hypothetical protein
MMNGRNNGKKLMAVRIVAHSFEIVRTIQLGPYTMTTSIGDFLLSGDFAHLKKCGKLTTSTSTDPYHDRPEPHPSRR